MLSVNFVFFFHRHAEKRLVDLTVQVNLRPEFLHVVHVFEFFLDFLLRPLIGVRKLGIYTWVFRIEG